MMGISLLPRAGAKISIFSIDPSSGFVGTTVQLKGNLTTSNGAFEVRFNETMILAGNADGNLVNGSFVVPETTAGNYSVKLTDVATGENDSQIFTVSTSYQLSIDVPQSPKQLQEGDSAFISINVTGGDASQVYVANVTVLTPAEVAYVKTLDLASSGSGTRLASIVYPNDFSSDATTRLVGIYSVFFNTTLSSGSFFVGLTNSTEYHRSQMVDVKAIYKQNENVTLTIAGRDTLDSVNLTADDSGLVHYANFAVPINASVGSYMVSVASISSGPTVKLPLDIQNFTVPGFDVNVTARNLAGDFVPNVEIRSFENGVSVDNATTGSSGLAVLKLEIGNYKSQAYFKSAMVGERDIEVADASSVDVVCNLTNLGVKVVAIVNGNPIAIPETGVFLTPDNLALMTDINGMAVAHSLLSNATYTLNVSRYGMPFNLTTVPQLLIDGEVVPWFNVTFTCPVLTLRLNVVKTYGQPIKSAVVQIQESLGGIRYVGNSDDNGAVTFNPAFGKYNVRILYNGIELNETVVDVFQDQNVSIYCELYGLNVSVHVFDYFGQAFSNVNVTLQRENSGEVSQLTQADGTATFNNVIGGSFEVAVYLNGRTEPTAAKAIAVQDSTSVQIRMDRYVLLAGFLVDTSQLAIALIIVFTLVVIISLEIYRRRRSKPQKTES